MSGTTEKLRPDHVEVAEREGGGLSKRDVTNADQHGPSELQLAEINERKTLRKMDYRVIPMVTILYLLSFLDRG